MHVHIAKTAVPGPYHLAVYVEGDYCPDHDAVDHMTHAAAPPVSACGPQCVPEHFTRLLTTMATVSRTAAAVKTARTKAKKAKK